MTLEPRALRQRRPHDEAGAASGHRARPDRPCRRDRGRFPPLAELFDKTPRVASHSDVGVIELMPTSDGETYGFKYVNGHPSNMKQGLQTVTAFGLLADVATGYPLLLSEMTILTALRTAATSAMAAKWLAPQGATHHGADRQRRAGGISGAGASRRSAASTEVRLYDIDPAATAKCARNLAGRGLQVVACASPEEAIVGAQIITTVHRRQAIRHHPDRQHGRRRRPHQRVGGDCPGKTELHRDILLRSAIFVEYPPQTRIEGEIQQLAPDHPVTELWQVIAGQAPGRTRCATRSPCSTAWALPSRISAPCAMSAPSWRRPGSSTIST